MRLELLLVHWEHHNQANPDVGSTGQHSPHSQHSQDLPHYPSIRNIRHICNIRNIPNIRHIRQETDVILHLSWRKTLVTGTLPNNGRPSENCRLIGPNERGENAT